MNQYKKRFSFYIFIVLILGVIQVYSASIMWAEFKYQDEMYFFKRQFIFMILGIICYNIASKIDVRKIEKMHIVFLFFSFLLMVLVLIPGIGVERNGSRSWFQFASFYVQPSELLKLTMIFSCASYLSKKKRIDSLKDILFVIFIILIGFLLIMLQPDFGSGIVMVCSIVVMVFVAGCSIKYFVYGGLAGVVGLVGLIVSAPYRLERITSFLNPWNDPLGSGFQIIQSLYAIAPGGLFGRGFNSSIQKQFYLPEPQTDFIFAIFAEEYGFIGSALLLFFYLMIIYNGIMIAIHAKTSFEGYVAIGIISLFAIQVSINLGVVVGLFPVTGQTRVLEIVV